MTETERKQLLAGLKALYAQNLDFLASVKNGTAKKKYKTATIMKFKKRNAELAEYITKIENGADCARTLREWCNLFGDVLVNALDDDNFPVGGGW